MDLSLNPIAVDPGAAAIFNTSAVRNGRAKSGLRLPEEMLEQIKGLAPEHLSEMRTHVQVGNEQYVCRGYVLQPSNGALQKPVLALYIHRHSSTMDAVSQLAAEYDLTEREREALGGICMGLSCKELAQRMSISPNTVKAFLRLVMIKLGVTRRSGIITKVLEYNRSNGHVRVPGGE